MKTVNTYKLSLVFLGMHTSFYPLIWIYDNDKTNKS